MEMKIKIPGHFLNFLLPYKYIVEAVYHMTVKTSSLASIFTIRVTLDKFHIYSIHL